MLLDTLRTQTPILQSAPLALEKNKINYSFLFQQTGAESEPLKPGELFDVNQKRSIKKQNKSVFI